MLPENDQRTRPLKGGPVPRSSGADAPGVGGLRSHRSSRRSEGGPAPRSSRRGEGGFTLIELMIVIAIIAVLISIAVPNLLRSKVAANETAAIGSLRTLLAAQSVIRQSDSDGNAVQDYWTGDVSGLFRLGTAGGGGASIRLIDIALARGDLLPLPAGAPPQPFLTASLAAVPSERSGYQFQSMTTDADGNPLQNDGPDTDGNAWENLTRFGFVTVPVLYGNQGITTMIIREDGLIYGRDTGNNVPVLIWPPSEPSTGAPPGRLQN